MTSRADDLDEQAAQLAGQATVLRGVADRVRLGNDGEMTVGAALEAMRSAGWQVLHDRRKSPQSPANLDHVVVGPAGVAVVDAKNWSGGLLRLDDRGMRMGSWRRDDALHAAKVDGDLVQGLARQVVPGVQAIGVLAFVQDVGLDGPQSHRGVVLVQQSELPAWLSGLPRVLTTEQVEVVTHHLSERLPPRVSPAGPGGRRGATAGGAAAVRAPRAASADAVGSKQQRARARARRDLKRGMVKVAVLLLVAVTLPVTFPVAQTYVLAPLAEKLSDSLVDGLSPPPAPVPSAP